MSFHQCLIRALSAVKLDLWFLKVRIQNSPRLLCLQDFQQTFPYKLHIAFHFLLYCSSSHRFLLVLQNLWKKRNGKFRMRNLILRNKMTTQVNWPCKSSGLHIACWALYQKCQDLEALPPKTEDSSSALPIRATLTLWQAFNLLQILFRSYKRPN